MPGWTLTAATVVPVALPGVLYGIGRSRLHHRGIPWPIGRDAAFAGALLCLVTAIESPMAADDEHFPVHVIQHLLLAMAAPVCFALAAPMTLALRSSSVPVRRSLGRIVRSRIIRGLSWAPTGAVLAIGGMYSLYLTGLYAETLEHQPLHDLVHAHMVVSGCLFTFAMIGPDPIRGRGSYRVRLATLLLAVAAHDILSKYLYIHAAALAQAHPGTGSTASWQLGARWMWYGGDLLELLVAVLFFAGWYAAAGRALSRERRRAQQAAVSPRLPSCPQPTAKTSNEATATISTEATATTSTADR